MYSPSIHIHLFALLSAHNMNSSEFIIPQDQIKNNIVTSGFFGKS